jgi:hypothetical protein
MRAARKAGSLSKKIEKAKTGPKNLCGEPAQTGKLTAEFQHSSLSYDPEIVRVKFTPNKAAQIFGETHRGTWIDTTAKAWKPTGGLQTLLTPTSRL